MDQVPQFAKFGRPFEVFNPHIELGTSVKPQPFGHYFILEKIAQGGMAEIFKGLTYDFMGLKKFIVIKRILPHIAAHIDFINMLVSEAKIAVNLSHGNIAQTYDLGKVGNDYFIVMEYVDGKNFNQIQKRCHEKKIPLSIEFAVYCISELCHGLNYIHQKKDEMGNALHIVHRDVSPQNMIVTGSGTLKIVDFGVAQAALKLPQPENGMLKGKFAYMSPEQTEGENVDHRSDLFSAGIVLWELLTARRLFKRKLNSETVEAVKHFEVPPPSHFRPEINPELDQIVLKALTRDLKSRYQSADEMSVALTRYLLKNHPDFKLSHIQDLFTQLFGMGESTTATTATEKTIRELPYNPEETTVTEAVSLKKRLESVSEDTQIVNTQDIDFDSIFDEFSLEDEREPTRVLDSAEELDPLLDSDDLSAAVPEQQEPQPLSAKPPQTVEVEKTATTQKTETYKAWGFLIGLLILIALLIYGLH